MMLENKVLDRPHICRLFFSKEGKPIVVNDADLLQNFFDTSSDQIDYEPVYSTQSKSAFKEVSEKTRAGYKYKQQLNASFPITSIDRSERLHFLNLVKFVAIELTNKRFLFIGRNDVKQNKRPAITYNTNEHIASIQVNCETMFPCGYSQLEGLPGFPYFIPNE